MLSKQGLLAGALGLSPSVSRSVCKFLVIREGAPCPCLVASCTLTGRGDLLQFFRTLHGLRRPLDRSHGRWGPRGRREGAALTALGPTPCPYRAHLTTWELRDALIGWVDGSDVRLLPRVGHWPPFGQGNGESRSVPHAHTRECAQSHEENESGESAGRSLGDDVPDHGTPSPRPQTALPRLRVRTGLRSGGHG